MANSNSQFDTNSLTKEKQEKLKNAVKKIDDSLTRIIAERDHVKSVIEELNDSIGMDKKLIRKLAKTYHKASFKMEKEENETFEVLYDKLYNVVAESN